MELYHQKICKKSEGIIAKSIRIIEVLGLTDQRRLEIDFEDGYIQVVDIL